MRRLDDDTVRAVGRLTLAATELEFTLASMGDDPGADFAAPGGALRAARESALGGPAELAGLVESAETYLAQSRMAVRAMWFENGRVGATTFDEVTGLLLRCRDRLREVLDAA